EAVSVEPGAVVAELVLRPHCFEEGATADNRLRGRPVQLELALEVAGHVAGAPAQLDDADAVACRLEQVLDGAGAEALVDHVRDAVRAGREAEVKFAQGSPPIACGPPPGRRGRRSCRARRSRP